MKWHELCAIVPRSSGHYFVWTGGEMEVKVGKWYMDRVGRRVYVSKSFDDYYGNPRFTTTVEDSSRLPTHCDIQGRYSTHYDLASDLMCEIEPDENTTGEDIVKTDIAAVLQERGSNYGRFEDHAALSQSLKDCLKAHPNWVKLTAYQKEALEMNMHKVARIVNGDPSYIDSWTDAAGYMTLAEKILKGEHP